MYATNRRKTFVPHVFQLPVIFEHIMQYEKGWKSMRTVNRHVSSMTVIRMVQFVKTCPEEIMNSFVSKCSSLTCIGMKNCIAVTDDTVQFLYHIYNIHGHLKYIVLDYCSNITEKILLKKPNGLFISIRGCWKIIKPCPSSHPEDTVELQVLALREIENDGYNRMLQFVEPMYRLVFHYGLSINQFHALFNNRCYRINEHLVTDTEAIVVVTIEDNHSNIFLFTWSLVKRENVWYTQRIKCG